MEMSITAASWLVGKALKTLSDDFDQAKIASTDLGNNVRNIKSALSYTLSLLHEAERRNVSGNHGLVVLLQQLNKLSAAAENVLDELEYFRIQDYLDNTQMAADEVHGAIRSYVLHGGQAVRHVAGKWLGPCIPYRSNLRRSRHASASNKLVFDRVGMSHRTEDLVKQLEPVCAKVSTVLKLMLLDLKDPQEDGCDDVRIDLNILPREDESEASKKNNAAVTYEVRRNLIEAFSNKDCFSVCSVFGLTGYGKTTLAQFLYNDVYVQMHYEIILWVDASSSFDVHDLSCKILEVCNTLGMTSKKELNSNQDQISELQDFMRMSLSGKRVLIVLDDMGTCDSKDEWEKFLAPLWYAGRGSVVLVTTHLPHVAAMVATTEVIKMEGLDFEDRWKIIFQDIFGPEDHLPMDLLDTGRHIASKMHAGSPKAARILANLLKKNLTLEHWRRVSGSKVWENPQKVDEVTLAIQLTYESLDFHLQKCLFYCALFPIGYQLDSLELTHIWVAAGVIDSTGESRRIEDVGLQYLHDLVTNHILTRKHGTDGSCYVMDSLYRKLVLSISSDEGLCIDYSRSELLEIKASTVHVSVLTGDSQIDHLNCSEYLKRNLIKLKKTVNIGNLRTLMIIGTYDARFAEFLKDIFMEIKHLRILRLFAASWEHLPHKFSKLVHLRCLTIKSNGCSMSLLDAICRFHHLQCLDLKECNGISDLPSKGLNQLVNLRHFLANKELHSKIADVGKLKFLQELRRFEVKDSEKFQLRQLGELSELGGSLSVYNLEKVRTKEEGEEAELRFKRHLRKLKLVWDKQRAIKNPVLEKSVLEGLQPHSNIRELHIRNHAGEEHPRWLCENPFNMLDTIILHDVAWSTLLPFLNIPNLKRLKLESMHNLQSWDRVYRGSRFDNLEELSISDCPKLTKLPLLKLKSLKHLEIKNCKELRMDASGFDDNSTEDLISRFRNLPARLEALEIDSISGVLIPSICQHFSATLTTLCFRYDDQVECFSEEQENALQLLGVLQELRFQCCNLRSLPAGLRNIGSLRSLVICSCPAIQSLPNEKELETSLWRLDLDVHSGCSELRQCKNYKGKTRIIQGPSRKLQNLEGL